MLCFREHLKWSAAPRRYVLEEQPVYHTPTGWLTCTLWRCDPLVEFVTWLGFLDTEEDGGLFFWRLDFWRAKIARWRWSCLLYPESAQLLTEFYWGPPKTLH